MMKTSIKPSLQCAICACSLIAFCGLIEQPSQAQIVQQNRSPLLQAQEAAREGFILSQAAAASLHTGNYTQAEAEARQAMSVEILPGIGEEVLAASLNAQGKDQEALQAYQMVIDHVDRQPRNVLPYALLLLKSGRWEQAVTTYNRVLPLLAEGEIMRTNSHFSPDVPEPTALAVAIHIATGLTYSTEDDWAREGQHKEMMAEFGKALRLAPDADLANYYYGFGWRNLDPKERAKMGSIQQAKASLQKAILMGRADVKKAAQKTLNDLNKPADKPTNKPGNMPA